MSYIFKFLMKQPLLVLLLTFLVSCGDPLAKLPGGSRDTPADGRERAKKNIEEGRGASIGSILGSRGGTNYEFSTSNPLWRATLETLDFLPLSTVDYSGGMIVSDWYTGESSNEAIKISIRFLSNEVRSDSLKIVVHKKKCSENQSCRTQLLNNSKISEELRVTILKKAAELEKEKKKK